MKARYLYFFFALIYLGCSFEDDLPDDLFDQNGGDSLFPDCPGPAPCIDAAEARVVDINQLTLPEGYTFVEGDTIGNPPFNDPSDPDEEDQEEDAEDPSEEESEDDPMEEEEENAEAEREPLYALLLSFDAKDGNCELLADSLGGVRIFFYEFKVEGYDYLSRQDEERTSYFTLQVDDTCEHRLQVMIGALLYDPESGQNPPNSFSLSYRIEFALVNQSGIRSNTLVLSQ